MIIKLKEDNSKKEIEVSIVYPQMNETVKKLEMAVRSTERTLIALDEENKTQLIKVIDILYIESVEKRVFIYTEKEVYRSEQTMLFMEEKLRIYNFVQISKSCILNLNHLLCVKPIFNARMEATLTNNEKVNISRKFVVNIKKVLEEM